MADKPSDAVLRARLTPEQYRVTQEPGTERLGHDFEDGPQPTGQRFCINSASLECKPESGS